MNQQQFEEFIRKVARNAHSPAETEAFLAWLQALPEEQAAAALDRYEQVFSAGETVDQDPLRRIEEGIESRLGPVHKLPAKRTPVLYYLKIAAVFVLVASSVAFFLYRHSTGNGETGSAYASQPIVPGKNQAMLKLAGGTSILLNETADGLITMNDKATGFEKKGGLLVAKGNKAAQDEPDNILETPKGGQYQLSLPDGSKVWLNASSRLHFPTAFREGERKVRLFGEAYFEVKTDSANPFIVETSKGVSLRVLGTNFNVNAYQEDAQETTTLLQGHLQVMHSQAQVLLKAGQQAVVNAKEIVDVREVETSYAVAWKEGYFMFNREPIKEVMGKIARWYDVEVVYQGPVTETRFWGTVSKFSHVNDVLDMLEATGRVHFTIEGRKIYVKK